MEKIFIEFVYPGIFMSETSSRETDIETFNNPGKVEIPEHSFGFRFYKQEIMELENGDVLKGKHYNTGWFYEGYEMTAKEVVKLGDEYNTLKANMKGSGYKRVVWNMFGQAIPMHDEDRVIKAVLLAETPRFKKRKRQGSKRG